MALPSTRCAASAFADVEAELVVWVADQAWMTEKARRLCWRTVRWLRERNALLPWITTLERLVHLRASMPPTNGCGRAPWGVFRREVRAGWCPPLTRFGALG